MYYRACGTNVPVPFSKRGSDYTHRNSVSKTQNTVTGADLKDNGDCPKQPIVQKEIGSTAADSNSTESAGAIMDNSILDKTHDVFNNSSTGTDLNKDTDPWVHKEIDQSRWD